MKNFVKILGCAALVASFGLAKPLIVGTNATYPPFEFIDDKSNVTGFDIDLVDELSKRAGFEYKILNMSFDGLIPALKSGKIDIAASAMSATEDRKKAIDFSEPYYVTENLFIKRKDSDINSKEILSDNKRVGVQIGTVQELAARTIKGANIVPNEDIFVAIMSLKNKKVDAVVVDSQIGYEYLKKNDDLVEFFKEPDGSEGFALAFDKGKQSDLIAKINAALEDMKKDGSYEKLLEKYELR